MKHNTSFHTPRPKIFHRKCRPRFGNLTLLLDDDNVVQKLHVKAKPEKLPEQHLWWWD